MDVGIQALRLAPRKNRQGRTLMDARGNNEPMRNERGTALQVVVTGLVVYAVAMGAGLLLFMFPVQANGMYDSFRRSFQEYAPHRQKVRMPVMPVASAEPQRAAKPVHRPRPIRPAVAGDTKPITRARRNQTFAVEIVNEPEIGAQRPTASAAAIAPAATLEPQDAPPGTIR